MKKMLVMIVVCLTLAGKSHGADLTLQGLYEKTANRDSDDTGQLLARLEHPIWREFSIGVDFNYQGRQYFPSVDDVKGAFGSIRGYGIMPTLLFRPQVNDRVSPYIVAGVGYYWWDFKENPFLQDNQVTVDVGNSLASKYGVGVDVRISEKWSLNLEVHYFTTEIPKHATDDEGVEWHILGDDEIGNEQWNFAAGFKYKF